MTNRFEWIVHQGNNNHLYGKIWALHLYISLFFWISLKLLRIAEKYNQLRKEEFDANSHTRIRTRFVSSTPLFVDKAYR